MLKYFFWLFFWSCGPNGQFVTFSSSLDQHRPPSTIDLRSRDRDNPRSLLFVPDKVTWVYLVGDNAEEFIFFHALGRKRLLVLFCGLVYIPLKILRLASWETIESFASVFYTPAAQRVFNRIMIGARDTSPVAE